MSAIVTPRPFTARPYSGGTDTAIEFRNLTKRYGTVRAVDDLSFDLPRGSITGFLGRNGAGKTTTLRMLLGLVNPTSGTATFGGVRYRDLPDPVRRVGALLEANSFHQGRRAIEHLRIVATAAGLARNRADEVLDQVGLDDVGRRRVGAYSLGMRQRLGLATALLGDPEVLILDEPTNGLDPDGVHWLRGFLRHSANDGRTVLVSSHLLSEVALTVDHVVIIDRGRLVSQGPVAALTGNAARAVSLRTPQAPAMTTWLNAAGFVARSDGHERVVVEGSTLEQVGQAVAGSNLVVFEMTAVGQSLEDAFLALTSDTAEGGR